MKEVFHSCHFMKRIPTDVKWNAFVHVRFYLGMSAQSTSFHINYMRFCFTISMCKRVQKGSMLCNTLELRITAWPSCDTMVSLWFKITNMDLEATWSHLIKRAAWNKRIQGILIYKYIWQLTNKHCSLNVWYRTLVIKLTYHWVTSIVEHLHWLKWKEAQKQVWQKTIT